jgi:hypothetical protein
MEIEKGRLGGNEAGKIKKNQSREKTLPKINMAQFFLSTKEKAIPGVRSGRTWEAVHGFVSYSVVITITKCLSLEK